MGPRAGGRHEDTGAKGKFNNVASTGQRLAALCCSVCSPALPLKAEQGPGARLPTGSGASPTDQLFTPASCCLGTTQPTVGDRGTVGGCPVCAVPRLSQGLAGYHGTLPKTCISPPLVADSLDSSTSSHTTGLAPGSQWLSGQPAQTCALIVSVEQRSKKERRKKGSGKEGWRECLCLKSSK